MYWIEVLLDTVNAEAPATLLDATLGDKDTSVLLLGLLAVMAFDHVVHYLNTPRYNYTNQSLTEFVPHRPNNS
jgi:hypothetical protein